MYRVLFLLVVLLNVWCAQAATVTVTVGDGGNVFTPAYFTINPGDTVKWVWVDGHHNTTPMNIPTGAATWYSNLDAITTGFILVPGTSGLYRYTCTHHSGMDGSFFVTGCSFPAKPVISGSAILCANDTMTLSTAAQTSTTYTWTRNGFSIAGVVSNTLEVTADGTYRVNVNRCGVDSISAPLVISTSPEKPAFTYTNTGHSYSFTNTTASLAAHSYIWTFGDGSVQQTTADAAHPFSLPGNYIVTLQATDIVSGCMDTTQQQLQVGLGVSAIGQLKYNIYPNPANDVLNIDVEDDVTLSLCNSIGAKLNVPVIKEVNHYTVNLINIPAGIYFLHIQSAKGAALHKVQVVR